MERVKRSIRQFAILQTVKSSSSSPAGGLPPPPRVTTAGPCARPR